MSYYYSIILLNILCVLHTSYISYLIQVSVFIHRSLAALCSPVPLCSREWKRSCLKRALEAVPSTAAATSFWSRSVLVKVLKSLGTAASASKELRDGSLLAFTTGRSSALGASRAAQSGSGKGGSGAGGSLDQVEAVSQLVLKGESVKRCENGWKTPAKTI